MKTEMITVTANIWDVLQNNIRWMGWNLFLGFVPLDLSASLFRRPKICQDKVEQAKINRWVWWLRLLIFLVLLPNALFVLTSAHLLAVLPLGLSAWLFYRGRLHSLVWWLGFLIFIAFLPNAPYVLTDVIHLISDIRDIHSVWINTLVVFPMYLIFILSGFEAYVLSLINLGYYLQRIGQARWVLGTELLIHALSAIGIYLGRFLRFNSWDFITQPDALLTSVVEDVFGKRPLVIIVITFVVLAGLYWIMKRLSLGVLLQRQNALQKWRVATKE